MAAKLRLDIALYERGLCDSREQAKRLVLAGAVVVNERPANKPGQGVGADDVLALKDKPRYVSRGGLKLEGALGHFGIDVTGWVALDAGASTGGFTDCLLQHGASRVYAYDVGTNQLVWKLRNDPRVISREQFNLRHLQPGEVPEVVDIAVFDVSFISLTLVMPPVLGTLHAERGMAVCLIKPQFELTREDVGPGGIVRDPLLHERAVEKIKNFVATTEFHWRGVIESPIKGTEGNTEYLACLSKQPAS